MPASWLKVCLTGYSVPFYLLLEGTPITILIQDPSYLALLAMEYLKQVLWNYGSNVWIATLMQIISPSFQGELTPSIISKMMNLTSSSLPFLLPPNSFILFMGPLFVRHNGDDPLPPLMIPQNQPSLNHFLSQVVL